jgi:hypothetical protein
MKRIGLLLTTLAACTATTDDTAARFHGTVDQAVTHVMAVSAVSGDIQKVLATTEAGGFSIAVEPGRPWTLVFVDASRVGSSMVRGVLRADTLDTFLPQVAGDIDLGKISIDNRNATMAGSSEELDTALGLSRRTLATIGGLDDIALRYANPDVNADGVLDVEQNLSARLEVHVEYALLANGRGATMDDFVNNVAAVNYLHLGTGIYGRLPESFGKVDRADADVKFTQPYYGTWAGDDTAAVPAGQPVTNLTFGDDRTFGVFCRPDHPIPTGDYMFRSGAHTLEFTLVRPPTEMTLNQVMPRLRFVPVDPACQSNCEIESVDFAWQRRMEKIGWVTITDEEAQALAPVGSIEMIFADAPNRRVEFPIGYATGSVPWQHDLYVSQSAQRTGDILFASVAFQTRPGLKMYATLGDATKAPSPFVQLDDAR